MSERRNNNLIVIFIKDRATVEALIECQIRLIRVADIVDEPESDFNLLLECLIYQIGELGSPDVCYLVDVTGSSLNNPEALTEPTKCLIYELQERTTLSSQLNKYQTSQLEDPENKEAGKSWDSNEYIGYKAPNNLTLLFTPDFDDHSAEHVDNGFRYENDYREIVCGTEVFELNFSQPYILPTVYKQYLKHVEECYCFHRVHIIAFLQNSLTSSRRLENLDSSGLFGFQNYVKIDLCLGAFYKRLRLT
eukprot:sb/3468785/